MFALCLAGCVGEDVAGEDVVGDADGDHSDTLGETSQALSAPHTVYVNFGGGTFDDCTACNLSASNRSYIVGTVFKQAHVTLAPAFAASPARKQSVMSYLRQKFEAYNVQFVEQRPASGNYTMLVVTASDPRPWDPNLAGYSPIDCLNASDSDISFMWRAERAIDYPLTIERLAAHELGHTFGLEHITNNPSDLMLAAGRDNATKFTVSLLDPLEAPHKCRPGETWQDGPARLRAGLGPSAAPPAIPTGFGGGPVASSQVWLNWDDSTDPKVAGYILKRNGATVLWRDKSGGSAFVDANLGEQSWLGYELYTYNYAGVWSTSHASLTTFTPAGTNRSWPLWRYHSSGGTDHYYTINRNDNGLAFYGYALSGLEGHAFPEGAFGTVPVYQYFSGTRGDHFYTTDWNELGNASGSYTFESVAFYIFPINYVGSVALYQYWNGTDHFYTQTYSPGGIGSYHYERVLGYIYP
jgi:uncharacterized protein DUF5648